MLRKNWNPNLVSESVESKSGTEIADSGFLIICEKPEDSGSRIRIAIPDIYTKIINLIKHFYS